MNDQTFHTPNPETIESYFLTLAQDAQFLAEAQPPAHKKDLSRRISNMKDRRVVATRRTFRKALLKLWQEKNLQKITVKELCEKAGVNRGTFYAHYVDIPSLMEQIEQDVYQDLLKNLKIFLEEPGNTPQYIYAAFLKFIRNNQDICTILLNGNGNSRFFLRLLQAGRETSHTFYKKLYPLATEQQLDLFYSFVSSGFIGILRYWISIGMQDEKNLTESLEKMIDGALQYLSLTPEEKNTESV